MPLKKRSTRSSLGTVSAGSYSDEIDMSSMTRGILYVTPDPSYSANFDIEVYFSPQDFGTAPDWYRLWGVYWWFAEHPKELDMNVRYNSSLENNGGPQAIPFPYPYKLFNTDGGWASEGVCPRRVRFKPVGTDVTLSYEGSRSIA